MERRRTSWRGLAPAVWMLAAACGGGTGGGADTGEPLEVLVDVAEDAPEVVTDAMPDALDTVSVRVDSLEDDADVPAPVDAVDVGPDVVQDVGPLPDRVVFRTATESFNRKYFVAVRDGALWFKPNTDVDPGATADWRLLGATGKPDGLNLPRAGVPEEVVAVSADDTQLVVISSAGVFYRAQDFTNAQQVEGGGLAWTDKWGWLFGEGPALHVEWPTGGNWAMSDSNPGGVGYYTDPNGFDHSVGNGVGTIYRLGPDGWRIHFNELWMPSDWSRQLCGPARGTLRWVGISGSGSTAFVIGEDGAMYTRLYDFDTGGENDLLTYSFVVSGPAGTTRKLPAEPWRAQPAPDGLVTKKITIFQTGQGNAARTLRVEGRHGEQTGFFFKGIYDAAWSFEATGAPPSGPYLNPPGAPAPATLPPDDHPLVGTLKRDSAQLSVAVLDFNLMCSPARVHLAVGGVTATVGGAPLELALHHVHKIVDQPRDTFYWQSGVPATLQAALIIPAGLDAIDDPSVRAAVVALLGGGRKVINFTGSGTLEGLTFNEISWLTAFLVPADEKALMSPFALTLAP